MINEKSIQTEEINEPGEVEREEALVESELNEQKILVQVNGGEHVKERYEMGQKGVIYGHFNLES